MLDKKGRKNCEKDIKKEEKIVSENINYDLKCNFYQPAERNENKKSKWIIEDEKK